MILHLIETGGPGGAEQMLLRLSDEYGRKGVSQMVCLRKEGWLADEVRKRGLPLEIEPTRKLPDFGWLRKFSQLSKARKITAIHAHEFAMNVRGALLGRYLGVPVVATVHGRGYYAEKWIRRQAYRLVSRSANLIAVSEDIRRHLISRCGIKSHRVSLILNGVDIDHFKPDEEKRRVFRNLFDVSDDHMLLGCIGSYYPVKGHYYLIEAMKGLTAIDRNVKLVLAGQGPLREELHRQAAERGLKDSVVIAGYIEDIPGLLSALDIFVMPSLSEGLPLALLEAAASKRSILATNVGGIPEIVTHMESGWLVPPGNIEALTDALVTLRDPQMRLKMASRVYAKVKKSWSLQHTADRYLNLLLPELSAVNTLLQRSIQ